MIPNSPENMGKAILMMEPILSNICESGCKRPPYGLIFYGGFY